MRLVRLGAHPRGDAAPRYHFSVTVHSVELVPGNPVGEYFVASRRGGRVARTGARRPRACGEGAPHVLEFEETLSLTTTLTVLARASRESPRDARYAEKLATFALFVDDPSASLEPLASGALDLARCAADAADGAALRVELALLAKRGASVGTLHLTVACVALRLDVSARARALAAAEPQQSPQGAEHDALGARASGSDASDDESSGTPPSASIDARSACATDDDGGTAASGSSQGGHGRASSRTRDAARTVISGAMAAYRLASGGARIGSAGGTPGSGTPFISPPTASTPPAGGGETPRKPACAWAPVRPQQRAHGARTAQRP
ncbi:hypothetical protein KFE25_006449 [Diacronema lutheri]|uniref:C2 NT-type domain-containing protein n=1 Tax=Diacronema lutheri TaxID=2081491 RepID=A0A8J5XT20_DIALT|nr:hypothetical protein KFE25_006449 [Diacronema lutheri]